jgi:hypothetical protein
MNESAISGAEPPAPKPKSRTRKIALYFIKLGIGIAILAFLLAKVDLNKVGRAITQLDARALFWIWFWFLPGLWCHSLMLQRALLPVGIELRTRDIYKINFQIRFYSLFMPGAANVLIKWHKLAKLSRQPGQALAVMAFTRILHTFAMLVLVVAGMLMDSRFPWRSLQAIAIGMLLLVSVSMLLATSNRYGRLLDRLAVSVLAPLRQNSWIRNKLQKLWAFFTHFRRLTTKDLVILLLLVTLGQLLQTLAHVTIARSLGMDITVWTQLWIRGVILICAVVPISVSGLGLREASIVGILTYYGEPEEAALAYSLSYFGLVVGIAAIGGLLEAYEHYFPFHKRSKRQSDSL